MARVNYVLRGMTIPSGEHEIEFVFSPTSLKVNTIIAFASIAIIIIAGAYLIITSIRKREEECLR